MLKKPELTIYLTNHCQLNCRHCFNQRSGNNNELSINDLNWILENIDNKRTTFLGGEPMLYPYLAEALEHFPKATVSTNGMLINEENVHILKKSTGVQLCLHPDTFIQLANGCIVKIGEKKPTKVVGYDFEMMRYKKTGCSNFSIKDAEQLLQIKTRTTQISATPQHTFPIITKLGEHKDVPASSLKKGDFLISPRYIPFEGKEQKLPMVHKNNNDYTSKYVNLPETSTPDFSQLLGYYIGDGLNTEKHRRYIAMYDKSKNILEKYKKLGNNIFNLDGKIIKTKNQNNYSLVFYSSQIERLFKKIKVPRSIDRHIPFIIQRGPNEQLARFIAGFCDAEGCITPNEIVFSSSSHDMICEIQMLLKRFGISSSIKEIKKQMHEKKCTQYSLHISGNTSKMMFSKNIAHHMFSELKVDKIKKITTNSSKCYECFPIKNMIKGILKEYGITGSQSSFKKKISEERIKKIVNYLFKKVKDRDIPVHQKEIAARLGESQQNISNWIGLDIKNRIVNGKIKLYLKNIKKVEKKEILLNTINRIIDEKIEKHFSELIHLTKIINDFLFDEIIDIKLIEYGSRVYDITVPKTNNFIANALLTHNSVEMGVEETNYIRGDNVWETVMNAGELLKANGIEHYYRASFWEGNLGHLKEFTEMDATLALFPRLDKPPLPPQMTSRLFEEVLKHENWILALPNFLQYLRKNGRCKAATERLNVYYDKKITLCNFDLEYHLGRIGDDEERIKGNIENFLMNNKITPGSCAGCKNVDVCRGSCYAAHVSEGCPLKYDFSISDFMERYKISEGDMKAQTLKVTNFMKRMLVC